MAVVFVRPQANFLAMPESGNILGNSRVAWSLLKNARLCLHTNIVHRVSASMELGFDLKKEATDVVLREAVAMSLWCLLRTCDVTLYLPHEKHQSVQHQNVVSAQFNAYTTKTLVPHHRTRLKCYKGS